MTFVSKLKGYRTWIFNFLAVLVPLWEALVLFLQDPGISSIIPAQYMPLYTVFVVLSNAYLRAITTTPVGRR